MPDPVEFFDAPPREFEMVDITFSAAVSAANFAQLKRHRMATLLAGEYNPALGVTVPEAITAAGLETDFLHLLEAAGEEHAHIAAHSPAAADSS